MMGAAEGSLSLRDRKRLRTRAALVEAGQRLFEERGYDETTVADIAAAAEIGTRTFFAYFETKEQLLFPESDGRVQAALAAIDKRTGGESPAQVLVRALGDATNDDDDMVGALARLRLRLIRDVPAVQARALRLQMEAQHEITTALLAAYPDLDAVAGVALVGAFIGATASVVQALQPGDEQINDEVERNRQLRSAVAYALGVTPSEPRA